MKKVFWFTTSYLTSYFGLEGYQLEKSSDA